MVYINSYHEIAKKYRLTGNVKSGKMVGMDVDETRFPVDRMLVEGWWTMSKTRAFTLIERTAQLRRAGFLIDGSSIPANFPFQAGSLTCVPSRVTETKDGVTTSQEGKPAVMVEGGLHLRHSLETGRQQIAGHLKRTNGATRSQSERLGERTGRRIVMTNDRTHRKEAPGGYYWQSRGRREEASPGSMGEACHSRGSKWKWAPASLTGVKGGGMCGRTCSANSGESLYGSARIRSGIRNSERRIEAVQAVGDGHSTEDPRTMKSLGEGRAISLKRVGGKEALA